MTSRASTSIRSRVSVGALATVLAAALAGCGSSATGTSMGADPADDFVGTWLYGDVSSIVTCANSSPLSQPPEPNKTLAHGATSALVDLSPNPLVQGSFCDLAFDVAGEVATAQPMQTCALTSLDSLTIDQPQGMAPEWTFTLNSATTAEELITATVHFSIDGAPTPCSWILEGHLTRISKD
jgi:hypothetical protein